MIHSYPWYISDWRESETRMQMNAETRGIYRELLDFCFRESSLPSDRKTLIKVAGVTAKEFDRAWPKIAPHFVENNGRLFNSKVTEILGKLGGYHDQRRVAAARSAEARRAKRASENRTSVDTSVSTSAQTLVERAFIPSTSTSTSTSTSPPTPSSNETPTVVPAGDPTYERFTSAYLQARPNTLPEEFATAQAKWKSIRVDDRAKAIRGILERIDGGVWTDPNFVMAPARYLKAEYKREVIPVSNGRPRAPDKKLPTIDEMHAKGLL